MVYKMSCFLVWRKRGIQYTRNYLYRMVRTKNGRTRS